MKHPKAKLDSTRERKIITARTLGFSIDELKQAIDGCAKSPWHMGKNDRGQKYDDIDLIFRNAEKIEMFIGLAADTKDANDLVSQIDQMAVGAI